MFWANQIPTVTSTDHEHPCPPSKWSPEATNHDAPKPPPDPGPGPIRRGDLDNIPVISAMDSSCDHHRCPSFAVHHWRFGSPIGEQEIASGHRIEVNGHQAMMLEDLGEGTEVLLLQARPIQQPIVKYGPFVMNTEAEIQEACADYRRTRFGN